MKIYKNQNNELFAFEDDGSQDHLILEGMILISEEEANAIRYPAPTSEQIKNNRMSEINERLKEIDNESVRPLRAFASGTQMDFDVQKLESLEIEAAGLREERTNL